MSSTQSALHTKFQGSPGSSGKLFFTTTWKFQVATASSLSISTGRSWRNRKNIRLQPQGIPQLYWCVNLVSLMQMLPSLSITHKASRPITTSTRPSEVTCQSFRQCYTTGSTATWCTVSSEKPRSSVQPATFTYMSTNVIASRNITTKNCKYFWQCSCLVHSSDGFCSNHLVTTSFKSIGVQAPLTP